MDRKIVELLKCGAGVKQVVKTLQVGKKRVRCLRERAKEYGYLDAKGKPGAAGLPPYPEAIFPESVDGRAIQPSEPQQLLASHRAWIAERLQAGWHAVTVFEELPVKVNRSSFYRYLERENLNKIGVTFRVVPEIIHRSGEALLLDWGKLRTVIDADGRKRTLWMFTGILGYSRYLMVRLVWSNDVATTLEAMASMFSEMGGVTWKVTSDNPKCFALEASKYEPLLNPAFERFAAHYGFIIEWLPPADPEKKGKIERTMPYVRRLYEAHGETWSGLEESQEYLNKKMAVANERKHGTTQQRPREIFQCEEALALKALPTLAYEIETFHEGNVRQDGHVRFLNKYYSTDEDYIDKKVTVLGNSTQVSIYHAGKLLEVHPRITVWWQSKSTKPQHLKPWERALEDHSVYRARAAKLGPDVEVLIVAILQQGQGFIDTRKIFGILCLDKSYEAEEINAACRQAFAVGSLSSRSVHNLLRLKRLATTAVREASGVEAPEQVKNKAHRFVRPLSVYAGQMPLFIKEGNA
jgi:hypothetical protein